MNEQLKAITIPKQQLEIISYEKDHPYGTSGGKLDRVTAKNLSLKEGDPQIGKALLYVIFNADLKAYLAPKGAAGFRFMADIEEKPSNRPEYPINRQVVQVYDNGEPVSRKKQGGSYGKSPDTIRLEHELAMELEAVRQVGALICAPANVALPIDKEAWQRITAKYWRVVERGLDNYMGEQAGKVSPPLPKAPATVTKPPSAEVADKSDIFKDERTKQQAERGNVSQVDLVRFNDTMEKTGWSMTDVIHWMSTQPVFKGLKTNGTPGAVLSRMNTEQNIALGTEITRRRKEKGLVD